MLGSPFAAALMFFSQPILLVWTRSPAVAAQASSTLAALALAMLLNSCMQVPYALQLASGQTRVSLWINGVGVLVMVPLLVGLVQAFGIFGGGLAWAAFNTAYFVAAPLLLHRRVLRGHLLRWLVRDTLPFLVLALACFGSAAWLGPTLQAALAMLAVAAALYAVAAAVAWPVWPITFRRARAVLPHDPQGTSAGLNAAAGPGAPLGPGDYPTGRYGKPRQPDHRRRRDQRRDRLLCHRGGGP